MKIQPRLYQREAVDSLYRYFTEQDGNPVVALPTGTGKSVVIAMFLDSIFRQWRHQKILILTHVKELIQQNYAKLLNVWPDAPAGVNSAGLGQRDIHQPILFAGIGSVAKHAHRFGMVHLIIIDEAHLVSPNDETMYRRFIADLRQINPKLKVIGLTATPWRLGQGYITDDGIFTDICFDLTTVDAFNRLIAEGYLCPLIPKNPRTLIDTDGIHMRGGEFIQEEMQRAANQDHITIAALKEAMELGHDRKRWLIFCAGVDHAVTANQMLNDLGVPCVTAHSKLANGERDKAIAAFKRGEVRAITNNNMLTTGIDVPEIDLIIVLRPTASTVLWVQMLGRGTRPAPGKDNCLVLDFAGNTRRLGPINDPVIPRKKGSKGGDAPVKECPQCNTWNHARAAVCFVCGFDFPIQTKLLAAASTEELIRGELPQIETVEVEHITYSIHTKVDRPPMMKVSYFCGLNVYSQYVCIEHEGYAGRMARQWWRERDRGKVLDNTPLPTLPTTTAEAMRRVATLPAATHLKVWINKKHPEILEVCFDGSAFGTKVPSDNWTPPLAETVTPQQSRGDWTPARASSSGPSYASLDIEDDDIPF